MQPSNTNNASSTDNESNDDSDHWLPNHSHSISMENILSCTNFFVEKYKQKVFYNMLQLPYFLSRMF